jgi:hypothetical protein
MGMRDRDDGAFDRRPSRDPSPRARDYGAPYGSAGRGARYDRDLSPLEAGWRTGGRPGGGWVGPGEARFDRENRWGSHDDERELRGEERGILDRAGDSLRRGWHRLRGHDYDRGYRGAGPYDRGLRGRDAEYDAGYGRHQPRGYDRGAGFEPGFPPRTVPVDGGWGARGGGGYDRGLRAPRSGYDADVRRHRDWF